MMRIFVTGSTGMLGQNLLPTLRSNPNYEIFAPTRQELNLLNYEEVNVYIKKLHPDLIIHLAAKVGGIQTNIKEPVEFLVNNVLISFNIIMAALNNNVPNLLNIGSSTIYPNNNFLINNQALNISPQGNEAYALAKMNSLKLFEFIHYQYQLNYKTLIPCNVFGPFDNFDVEIGHLIPAVMHRLYLAKIQNLPEVTIWGNGKEKREFLYVEDLVNFILLAIKQINNLPQNINIGFGKDYTIDEYYHLLNKIIGFTGLFKHDLSKPAGPQRLLLDSTPAKHFGWQPQISILEGIAKTYQNFLLLFQSL